MHGRQSMQNTLFRIFETDFCSKSENSPPIGIGNKNVTALTPDWKKIRLQKINPNLGRYLLFFWSSPNFGPKTGPNPGEDRFFFLVFT